MTDEVFHYQLLPETGQGLLTFIHDGLANFTMVVYQTASIKAGRLKAPEWTVKQAAILQDSVAA